MTLIPVQEMRIPAADAASILSAFSSGFPQVLLIFTAQKGRHPGKNCATPMDNPNQTSLLKPPAYGFESSPDGKDVFLCRYKKPAWKLRLQDADVDKEKLAATLRKAAEWLMKR